MSKNPSRKPAAKPEKEAEKPQEVEAAVADENAVKDEEPAEVDPIDELNQEIEKLQKQLNDSKTELLRAYADTENTRKRLQRETDNAKKYRFQSAAMELLPILDNLDLALAAKPDNAEVENFVRGFEMIRTQFMNALQNEGVQEIEALNQPFDANYMQALATEKVDGVEPGHVVQVLQKGYKLKDRMLRPALVKVSE